MILKVLEVSGSWGDLCFLARESN